MNAARHAGAGLAARPAGNLGAFGRDHHLGGIVSIDEPHRAIVEREQEALAFVIGLVVIPLAPETRGEVLPE